MAIDRIGKKPGAHGPEASEGTGAPEKTTGASFSEAIDAAKRTDAAPEVGASDAASPLARLQRGEISVDQYVDAKIDEAMQSGSAKALPADAQAMLRDELRARMTDASHLSDLMQWVRGTRPQGT